MKRDLIFLGQFTSEFNGSKYEMFRFVDPITLRMFYGTNLTISNLKENKTYQCTLVYRRKNKEDTFRVESIQE